MISSAWHRVFAAMVGPLVAMCMSACASPNQPSVPSQPITASAGTLASQPSVAPSPSSGATGAAAKPASPAASPAPPPAAPARWNFDRDAPGSVPAGAQVFSGQWAVRTEPDAPSPPNALCQTGRADFPAISLDTRSYTDLTILAKFKPISGKEDQAGGLIFRVQDKDNYYIARGNALEDNLIFFIYQNARRSQLKSAGAKVANGVWHDLRVDVRGTTFVAFLDGQQVVDVTDDRYRSGGIGLWTKSDSVTCFDDVMVMGS